jgi:hypothetical protein
MAHRQAQATRQILAKGEARVVAQITSDAAALDGNRDAKPLQQRRRAYTAPHQDCRRVDCTRSNDDALRFHHEGYAAACAAHRGGARPIHYQRMHAAVRPNSEISAAPRRCVEISHGRRDAAIISIRKCRRENAVREVGVLVGAKRQAGGCERLGHGLSEGRPVRL